MAVENTVEKSVEAIAGEVTGAGADSSPVEQLHERAAAGTPGLTGPGTDQHGFVAHSHGRTGQTVPAQSRAERPASFDVDVFPVPGGREEDWRFTPLDRLGGLLEGPASNAQLEWSTELPEGVEVGTLAADDPRRLTVPRPLDRVGALAVARADGSVVVRIPARAQLEKPVVLRLHGTGNELVWGHVILDVGREASATVVVEHTGRARFGAVLSVLVGDAAHLRLACVQDWDPDAVHVTHVASRLGRDATLHSTQVTLGGDLVRVTETVEFAGTGGDATLNGVYFADPGQHLEHRLFIDHGVPHCRSNVTYKGALQGDGAHTVWVGDVLIRAAAEGTDTYELNRNLVLTDGARADSVPNLEIETGEIVRAGHASATGRFDDEQLFYLQARGIPEDQARRLVVRGFFAELVERIGVREVEEHLMAAIEAELSPAAAPVPGVDLTAEQEVTA